MNMFHASLYLDNKTERYQINLDIPEMYTKQTIYDLSCRKKSSKDVYRFSTNVNKLEKRFNKYYEGSMAEEKLSSSVRHFTVDLKNKKKCFQFDLDESIGKQHEMILISDKYNDDKLLDHTLKGHIQFFLSPYFEIDDPDTGEPILIINKQSMENKKTFSYSIRDEYMIIIQPPMTIRLAYIYKYIFRFCILCSLEWKYISN